MITNVTVFGGSRPNPTEYDAAQRLGHLLAAAGYTVLTGGYIGTMEAVSRGASEAGGHVVGITCEEIEAWRPVKANHWVKEERKVPRLRERLFGLIESCDAAVALPGGPGTLAEIAIMWNHLLTGAILPRPLILIGPGWRAVFETFYRALDEYTPADQRVWLLFADTVESAVEAIQTWQNPVSG
jgi:uncharacterized protein (TIGR00730 family)